MNIEVLTICWLPVTHRTFPASLSSKVEPDIASSVWQAERLASRADVTTGQQPEVLRGVRNFLYTFWSTILQAEVLRGLRSFLYTDRPEHHSIYCVKEGGMRIGSGCFSSPRWGRICVEPDQHWQCSLAIHGEMGGWWGGARMGLWCQLQQKW